MSLLDFREHGWCAVYLKPLNKELFVLITGAPLILLNSYLFDCSFLLCR